MTGKSSFARIEYNGIGRVIPPILADYFLLLTNDKDKQDGVVTDALPDTKFKVKLNDGREVLAYLAGKMRINHIKVIVGDKVTLELSPDGTKGRIIFRR